MDVEELWVLYVIKGVHMTLQIKLGGSILVENTFRKLLVVFLFIFSGRMVC